MCGYIISALLLLGYAASAQKKESADSVRQKLKLTAVRVGVDIVQPIKTFASTDFSGFEAVADVELRNYYPTVEIGRWSRDVGLSNGQYTNTGNYWRVGVDVNLLKKDPIKNMFFAGIRYGRSTYDEQLTYTITSTIFGESDEVVENKNMKAGWLELTTGLRVRVMKNFWMGYTGRLKFLPQLQEKQQLQSYDVPGYGLTFKQPWWGFNYYLMFNFGARQRK